MMKSSTFLFAAATAALLLWPGCIFNREISARRVLQSGEAGPIRVYTTDSSLYTLQRYALGTAEITGSGIRRTRGLDSAFDGSISLNTVAYISAQESDFWKTTVSLFMIGFIGGYAAEAFRPREMVIYPPGSGSCPSIYSGTGGSLAYDGDGISTAFGRALEGETSTLLAPVPPSRERLNVRILNERRETHYINAARVEAYCADSAASVVLASDGTAWPVYAPLAAVSALDAAGRSVTGEISARDGVAWRSDLSGAVPASEYRDVITLAFTRGGARSGRSASRATFVLSGSNTSLPLVAMEQVLGFLGDESLSFYRSAETDPGTIAELKEWLDECSMRVEYYDGSRWVRAGSILPEANGPVFTRALRIETGPGVDTLFVRLSCLTDTWTIDEVRLDWYDGEPCPEESLDEVEVHDETGSDVRPALFSSDDRYSVLLPGSHIDIGCALPAPVPGRRWWYGLKLRGYLHEWIPSPVGGHPAFSIFDRTKGPGLETVTYLLGRRDLLLGALYAYWETIRGPIPPAASPTPAGPAGDPGTGSER
jgi:hypothetical protein